MTCSYALHEMWRFKELRTTYFHCLWNIVDFVQVVAFFLYLALKSLHTTIDDGTVDNVHGKQIVPDSVQKEKDAIGAQAIIVLIVLMKSFLITHCFIKVIYYLRIYDNVRQFILLVSACVDDFIPFFYFFASQVIMFSFIFSVLDVKFGPPGKHKDLNPMVV